MQVKRKVSIQKLTFVALLLILAIISLSLNATFAPAFVRVVDAGPLDIGKGTGCQSGHASYAFQLEAVMQSGVLISNTKEKLVLTHLAFGFTEEPNPIALSHLSNLIGQMLTLCDVETDRYRRLKAQRVLFDNNDLEYRLILMGAARFSGRHQKAKQNPYVEAEDLAYSDGRGAWETGGFSRLNSQDPGKVRNGFQIIKGAVSDIAMVRNTLFINFGNDWRTDVTIGISKPSTAWKRVFQIDDYDALIGREVEARGVVRWYNGPFLEVHDLAQMRLLPHNP